MAYKSKFKGKEIDDKLDLVQKLSGDISDLKEDIKNIIKEETDPVFSNSPAADITDQDKTAWNNKQDNIEDLEDIRRGASKGATALQQSNVDSELSLGSRNPVQNAAVTEAVSQIGETVGLMYNMIEGLEEDVANKQNAITDLTTIREGAARGATALQSSDVDSEVSETSTNPVQNKVIAGALTEIVGMLDTALSSVGERFDSKQDNLVSGENIKTINGESILGSGNISIEGVDNVYIADFTLRNMTATADTTIDFASLRNAMREGKVILVSSELDSYMVATTRYIPGVGRNPNKIYISVTDGIIIYNSTAISNPASIKSSENFKSTIATTDYVDNKGSNVYVMDIKLNALSNDQDVTFDYASLESAINEGKIILIEDDLSPKMMFVVNASLQGDSIIMKVSNTLSYIWATAYSNGDGTGIIQANAKIYKPYATEEYVNNAVEDVNVKGDDGYVYSNGEKVDMRFTRSLIPVGTNIPAKANLNTVEYLKVGKYYCSLNADAKTITNCPTANAFMMEVFNPLSTVVDNEVDSTYVYRIRILTEYSTGIQYVQYCTVGSTVNKWTYDSWYVCPRTKFTLNSNKNDGSAALGSASQGVYINSEGTFVKMNYTIAKSVPSSAVFTDTKVTAVGNHYTPVENESVVIEAPDGEVVIGLKRDAAGHVVGVISTPMSGSGGGGITVETDPIFSASPAAAITEDDIAMWNGAADLVKGHDTDISQLFNDIEGKQDVISDLEAIRDGASKGATALQEHQSLKTINGESIVGSGDITIAGGSGEKGDKGDKGDTGVGVQSVVQTTTSNDDDGSNVITVTLTDGTESTFTVKNGSKGDTGAYPIVESSETSVILSANKMIRITTQIVDSMEIILPDEIEGLTSECVVTFNIDESSAGAELIVPADVRWSDGIIPTMTAGKTYEISFLNRCATFLEF